MCACAQPQVGLGLLGATKGARLKNTKKNYMRERVQISLFSLFRPTILSERTRSDDNSMQGLEPLCQ